MSRSIINRSFSSRQTSVLCRKSYVSTLQLEKKNTKPGTYRGSFYNLLSSVIFPAKWYRKCNLIVWCNASCTYETSLNLNLWKLVPFVINLDIFQQTCIRNAVSIFDKEIKIKTRSILSRRHNSNIIAIRLITNFPNAIMKISSPWNSAIDHEPYNLPSLNLNFENLIFLNSFLLSSSFFFVIKI